jgi:hypothetical protein
MSLMPTPLTNMIFIMFLTHESVPLFAFGAGRSASGHRL